jgi:hypothetical protein
MSHSGRRCFFRPDFPGPGLPSRRKAAARGNGCLRPLLTGVTRCSSGPCPAPGRAGPPCFRLRASEGGLRNRVPGLATSTALAFREIGNRRPGRRATRAALDAFVSRRKAKMSDMWYPACAVSGQGLQSPVPRGRRAALHRRSAGLQGRNPCRSTGWPLKRLNHSAEAQTGKDIWTWRSPISRCVSC